MGFLIQFVADTAPFIYALCGFLALFQLYRTWQTRAERRQSIFSLEREKALNDLYGIFVSAMGILVLMGVTYFISTTLSIAVEPIVEEARNPQPADVALIPTPTNTPLPATPTPLALPTSALSDDTEVPEVVAAVQTQEASQPEPVIQEPTPEPTATPEPLTVAPALCADGRSAIVSPGNGAVVSGSVAVVGTAQHDQFSYYKLEIAPGGGAAEGYTYFDGGQSEVVGGLLGSLPSTGFANGVYTIQLVVVDVTGNYPQPCRVTLTIQN